MSGKETVYLEDVDVVRETNKALMVLVENEEIWIPKSQIHADSEVKELGDSGFLAIPRWLAEENDIEGWDIL